MNRRKFLAGLGAWGTGGNSSLAGNWNLSDVPTTSDVSSIAGMSVKTAACLPLRAAPLCGFSFSFSNPDRERKHRPRRCRIRRRRHTGAHRCVTPVSGR